MLILYYTYTKLLYGYSFNKPQDPIFVIIGIIRPILKTQEANLFEKGYTFLCNRFIEKRLYINKSNSCLIILYENGANNTFE